MQTNKRRRPQAASKILITPKWDRCDKLASFITDPTLLPKKPPVVVSFNTEEE